VCVQVTGIWQRSGSAASTVVQLELPEHVRAAGYGVPANVFLIVTELAPAEGMVDIEVVWEGKPATRLYEGFYLEMRPVSHATVC